jgi:hypothetical protein
MFFCVSGLAPATRAVAEDKKKSVPATTQQKKSAPQVKKTAGQPQAPLKMTNKEALPDIQKPYADTHINDEIAIAQQKSQINEYEGKRNKLIIDLKNAFIKMRCGLVTIDANDKNIIYKRGVSSYTTSKEGEIMKAHLSTKAEDDTAFFKWFVDEISNGAGTVYTAKFVTYQGAEAAQCFLLQAQNNIREYISLFSMFNELGERTSK